MQGKLELVGEEAIAPPAQSQKEQAAAIQMLRIGLTALSQRFIVAIASLVDFTLITSAFALWWSIITEPTTLQMETATIYSLFILAVIWMRRRS
jgi:hypothetical protein